MSNRLPDWVYKAYNNTDSIHPDDFHRATAAFMSDDGAVTKYTGWVRKVTDSVTLKRSYMHYMNNDRIHSTMRFISDDPDCFGGPSHSNSWTSTPVAESKDVFDRYHSAPGYYLVSVDSSTLSTKTASEMEWFYNGDF